MISALKFAVLALATRRAVTLITDDKITEGVRESIIQRFPPETNRFGYLVTCRKCSSVWAGLGIVLLSRADNPFTRMMVQALALSEVTIISDMYIRRELDM